MSGNPKVDKLIQLNFKIMMDGKMEGGMMCNCLHHKVVPGLIVAFGLTFLLAALGTITMQTRDIIWPTIIVLAGLMKMSRGMCSCCKGVTCGC